jgi:hypothetical protein
VTSESDVGNEHRPQKRCFWPERWRSAVPMPDILDAVEWSQVRTWDWRPRAISREKKADDQRTHQ